MAGVRFVDTNVLLYAVSRAASERRKAEAALEILEKGDVALSVQVLQEFYVQATRASRADRLTREQASLLIESWLRFPIQDLTVPLMRAALDTTARFRISYWDAMVIEASRAMGCTIILSEDLNDGQTFDGVRVQNPFRTKPRRSAG